MKKGILGTPLKMKFRIENGLRVCQDGEVIIEGVRHRVQSGFVKCNKALNGRSWDTTKERELCPVCYHQPQQLTLNF